MTPLLAAYLGIGFIYFVIFGRKDTPLMAIFALWLSVSYWPLLLVVQNIGIIGYVIDRIITGSEESPKTKLR